MSDHFHVFHFAACEELTKACLKSGSTCVAYELVSEEWGLPLLQPMSEVAGRMSVIMGAYYMGRPYGGSGLLPMGVPGVSPANVFVIGGGTVGVNAAKVASGLGAKVTIADINHRKLAYLADVMPSNCVSVYSDSMTIANTIKEADLVIGLSSCLAGQRLEARKEGSTSRRCGRDPSLSTWRSTRAG